MKTKTLELENPDSCINRAEADEPVFVLRAKDPIAAEVVRYWCYRAMTGALHERDKIEEAMEQAQEMDDWRNAKLDEIMEGTDAPADPGEPAEEDDDGKTV